MDNCNHSDAPLAGFASYASAEDSCGDNSTANSPRKLRSPSPLKSSFVVGGDLPDNDLAASVFKSQFWGAGPCD